MTNDGDVVRLSHGFSGWVVIQRHSAETNRLVSSPLLPFILVFRRTSGGVAERLLIFVA